MAMINWPANGSTWSENKQAIENAFDSASVIKLYEGVLTPYTDGYNRKWKFDNFTYTDQIHVDGNKKFYITNVIYILNGEYTTNTYRYDVRLYMPNDVSYGPMTWQSEPASKKYTDRIIYPKLEPMKIPYMYSNNGFNTFNVTCKAIVMGIQIGDDSE